MIQSVSAHFHRPIRTGEAVTATVSVKEIRKDQGVVLLDCRCTDATGAVIAEASFESKAPTAKIRKELPEHDLDEVVERCKGLKPIPTGIVHPCSEDALLGRSRGGRSRVNRSRSVWTRVGDPSSTAKIDLANYRIVATADPEESAAKAAAMAGAGEIQALMKGSLHTDQYMHAVLSKENKLRTGRLLSHCMLIAAPTYSRRIIISDVAVNIAPDVDQKKDIIQNAIPGPSHWNSRAEGGGPVGRRSGADQDARTGDCWLSEPIWRAEG